MKIENSKHYQVEKMHFSDSGKDINYGIWDGESVKAIIKGYKWDETFEMFFSEKGTFGYSVVEMVYDHDLEKYVKA